MIRITATYNRKVGEAGYCSRGAGVSVEAETEAAWPADRQTLRARLDELFALAREAVDDQLQAPAQAPAAAGPSQVVSPPSNGNGHRPGPQDGTGDPAQPVSNRQIHFLARLADESQLDADRLAELCQKAAGVRDLCRLTRPQASRLIDLLQAGNGPNGDGAGEVVCVPTDRDA